MFPRRRGNSSVWNPTGSGDMIGTESGCLDEGDDHGGSGRNSNNRARRLIRQRGQREQREIPPPLTTSVTRRDPSGPLPTARRRFNFFRRRSNSDNGQQGVAIEARERVRPETEYYMRTQRNNGRLTLSLENLNINEDADSDDNDNDNEIVEVSSHHQYHDGSSHLQYHEGSSSSHHQYHDGSSHHQYHDYGSSSSSLQQYHDGSSSSSHHQSHGDSSSSSHPQSHDDDSSEPYFPYFISF